jgi:hypothetical protein
VRVNNKTGPTGLKHTVGFSLFVIHARGVPMAVSTVLGGRLNFNEAHSRAGGLSLRQQLRRVYES